MRTARVGQAALCALMLTLAGCGGGASGAEAETSLATQADAVERTVDERVAALAGIRSSDELSLELGEARAELEHTAVRISRTEVGEDLRDEQDALEKAVQRLAGEIATAQEAADAGDARGAAEAVGAIDTSAVEAAIERVRAETG